MNHLFPPFNDVRAPTATLMVLTQRRHVRTVVGNNDSIWKFLKVRA
jgi:peptide/nickel transport system substrate-binding protein